MNPVIPRRRLVRFVLKRILIHTLWLTGLLALAKWWVQRRGVVVLTFHRVLRREGWLKTRTQKGMIVTDESFRQLLQYLKKKDYSTISLNDDIQLNAQKRIRLALTFDDGWEDNASIAFPIARE